MLRRILVAVAAGAALAGPAQAYRFCKSTLPYGGGMTPVTAVFPVTPGPGCPAAEKVWLSVQTFGCNWSNPAVEQECSFSVYARLGAYYPSSCAFLVGVWCRACCPGQAGGCDAVVCYQAPGAQRSTYGTDTLVIKDFSCGCQLQCSAMVQAWFGNSGKTTLGCPCGGGTQCDPIKRMTIGCALCD